MKRNLKSNTRKPHTSLRDTRDLVRLMTVVLFIPWFGAFTTAVFGFEAEFEAEVAVLISFVLFGSFWCGWICPFGNLSYFVSRIGQALFPSIQVKIPKGIDQPLRYLKYGILAVFLYVIVTHGIDYFFGEHMDMYLSTGFTTFFIKFKKYTILLIPLLIPRFFCKYLCFQKGIYNIFNRVLPFVGIRRDAGKCMDCGQCDRACPMDIPISTLSWVNGRDCVGCYACVDEKTCPSKADAMSLRIFGRKVNPLYFAVVVIPVYYLITWLILSFNG